MENSANETIEIANRFEESEVAAVTEVAATTVSATAAAIETRKRRRSKI